MQTLRQHCRTNGIQTPKQGPSFEVVTKLQDSSPAGRYTAPSFAREGEKAIKKHTAGQAPFGRNRRAPGGSFNSASRGLRPPMLRVRPPAAACPPPFYNARGGECFRRRKATAMVYYQCSWGPSFTAGPQARGALYKPANGVKLLAVRCQDKGGQVTATLKGRHPWPPGQSPKGAACPSAW